MPTSLPDKLFFKIGEVAQLVGVRPHVLRYWESEFPALKPMKTRGAHRVYRRQDVELSMLIRRLLQEEGYTIPGAKRRLRELGKMKAIESVDPTARRELDLRAELIGLRTELSRLLGELDTVTRPGEAVEPAMAVSDVSAAAPAVRAGHGGYANGKKGA